MTICDSHGLVITPRGILSVTFPTFVLLVSCASVPPPTGQMTVAKSEVAEAVSEGGTEYAPEEMKIAQEKLNLAGQAMTAEDYENARRLAEEAETDARLAAARARAAKAKKAGDAVHAANETLRKEIDSQSP